MIVVVQRVKHCSVVVNTQCIAHIDAGVMALVCAELADEKNAPVPLADTLVKLRILDDNGKMNKSLLDTPTHNLLLIPQFTLAADCRKGNRPSFTQAAPPEVGRLIFERFHQRCQALLQRDVAIGEFGAEMDVSLCNHGPATFILR